MSIFSKISVEGTLLGLLLLVVDDDDDDDDDDVVTLIKEIR